MTAFINVPNVGEGHLKVTFDGSDVQEKIRAERIVTDMLARGYILIAEVEPGEWARVEAFDATRCEYVIADFGPPARASVAAESATKGESDVEEEQPETKRPKARVRPAKKRRVDARKTNVVGVAKTAGG